MKTIYLIGTTGAARTSHEYIARAFQEASGYRRCTQEEYLQRMQEIQALDLPPEPTKTNCDEVYCPDCHSSMYWEDCDACGGEGYRDVYDLDYTPLCYNLGDVEMCNQCCGIGGWWTCSCSHIYPTETDRTASSTASNTPAAPPADPPAGRQQTRQQEGPL